MTLHELRVKFFTDGNPDAAAAHCRLAGCLQRSEKRDGKPCSSNVICRHFVTGPGGMSQTFCVATGEKVSLEAILKDPARACPEDVF